MPLEFSDAPSEVDIAVESGLQALAPTLNPQGAETAALSGSPMTLGIRDQHRVYYLALEDLAAGAGLAAAELIGWRVLIDDGKTLLAGAQVPAAGQASASFDRSPDEARQLERAFTQAEGLEFVETHPIEPRLLSVPSLYTTALWLFSLDSADSVLMLLALDGKTLEAPMVWTEKEFLQHVHPRAERLQRMSEDEPTTA